MTKSMKIIHGLVILAILGFIFCWFQLRPSHIRKVCVKTPQEKKGEDSWSYEKWDMLYKICLNEHGLKN